MRSSIILFFLVPALFIQNACFAQITPKREFRAVWIATVGNIDWPSKPGLQPEVQREEFRHLLNYHQLMGMNAVIVQVRPCADAFYPSTLEPWSQWLTGTRGLAPAPFYDPLEFMIEETHQRGMEFHAWLNPYRAMMNADKFFADSTHLALDKYQITPDSIRSTFDTTSWVYRHPDWFLQYGDRLYFDPGLPAVRNHILNVVYDIVRRYDVDAIHMDDYFYPYRIQGLEFPDTASFRQFNDGFSPDQKDDWRRHNVDLVIEMIQDSIKSIKPHVKFGISPFGVWRNDSNDPEGSQTKAGQTNYDDLYANILKWLKNGWIDYVVPQLYWQIGFDLADYKILANWWNEHSYGKSLYFGQGLYRVDENSKTPAWQDPEEIIRQINLNRSLSNVSGSAYFSSRSVINNKLNVRDLVIDQQYRYPALIPAMTWLDSIPPAPVDWVKAKVLGRSNFVEWSPATGAHRYVIYSFRNAKRINLNDPEHILKVVDEDHNFYQDYSVRNRRKYVYVITALDRLSNESLPTVSNEIKFRLK